MTQNQIRYWELQETKRSNSAKETETNRANVAREGETHRANVANETETNRSNVAREKETNRHNLATEGIDLGKLEETKRHNVSTEGETKRHNVATESIDMGKLGETIRHNQAAESLSQAQIGLGYSQLAEAIRSNKRNEQIRMEDVTSNSALRESMARLNDMNRNWGVVLNDQQTDINEATKLKIQAEIDKLYADIENNSEYVTQGYINQLNNSIRNLENLIGLGG